jgi:uncharacterized protein
LDHDAYPDEYIVRILAQTATIAMVGASPDQNRPSHGVMRFLQERGYRVVPVNPNSAEPICGEQVYQRLADVPIAVDLVDIFRSSEAAGAIVDEVIAIAGATRLKAIWMQLGVRDDAAAQRAEQHGLDVVMNRCPKIEYARLGDLLAVARRS